jgi:hypothetical protein
MKTTIKYPNYVGVAFALFLISFFCCSCSNSRPPDPLAGFYRADEADMDKNKLITDDYKTYIQNLSPKDKQFLGPILYFEDGKGQHAVQIETDVGGKDCWYHILFYDKTDKRINVIEYFYGRYIS